MPSRYPLFWELLLLASQKALLFPTNILESRDKCLTSIPFPQKWGHTCGPFEFKWGWGGGGGGINIRVISVPCKVIYNLLATSIGLMHDVGIRSLKLQCFTILKERRKCVRLFQNCYIGLNLHRVLVCLRPVLSWVCRAPSRVRTRGRASCLRTQR